MTQEEFDQLNLGPSLSEKERQELGDLLTHYREVFAFTPYELGDTRVTEHVIDTGDTPLVHVPGRRVNPAVGEIIWTELETMREAGVVHLSQSL